MKKSDTFLNLVFWVIAASVFATGAVIVNSHGEWGRQKTSAVQPEVFINLEPG